MLYPVVLKCEFNIVLFLNDFVVFWNKCCYSVNQTHVRNFKNIVVL
jgi:hypothetical protein